MPDGFLGEGEGIAALLVRVVVIQGRRFRGHGDGAVLQAEREFRGVGRILEEESHVRRGHHLLQALVGVRQNGDAVVVLLREFREVRSESRRSLAQDDQLQVHAHESRHEFLQELPAELVGHAHREAEHRALRLGRPTQFFLQRDFVLHFVFQGVGSVRTGDVAVCGRGHVGVRRYLTSIPKIMFSG